MQFLQFLGCWEIEIIILTWKAGIVLRIRARVDTMTNPMEITAITCDRVWNMILSEKFFCWKCEFSFFEAACFRWSKSPVVLYFVDGITRNVPVSIHLRGVQSHYWFIISIFKHFNLRNVLGGDLFPITPPMATPLILDSFKSDIYIFLILFKDD